MSKGCVCDAAYSPEQVCIGGWTWEQAWPHESMIDTECRVDSYIAKCEAETGNYFRADKDCYISNIPDNTAFSRPICSWKVNEILPSRHYACLSEVL